MKRTILIVEDQQLNRHLLKQVLQIDYTILEAENGIQAIQVLEKEAESLSAIILDLIMPQMDGYAVLSKIRQNFEWAQIPVIVATGQNDTISERKALKAGAKDYVTKPYDMDILRNRLWNTIQLREQAAIANAIRIDSLTGLYSRTAFFDIVSKMIEEKEPGYFVMACFDIDNFKIINDRYGSNKGDQVLRDVAEIFRDGFDKIDGIVARIMADNYAVLYPRSFMETEELAEIRDRIANLNCGIASFTYSIGRYVVEDKTLEPSAMYDRALIAKECIKGQYDKNITVYDETMRDKILTEQEIISEMKQALLDGQFEIWYQPQFSHATGALLGAEALVRWNHPVKGIIQPGVFIPIFEKNGFIYEVDKYVWEQVCILLNKLYEEEKTDASISVNISRYDIFQEGMVDYLNSLVKKYKLPYSSLRLEITESAFSKSGEQVILVVQQLKEIGFTIEIDDFGSGFSSLNILKDVPADVIKLDMKFLEGDRNSDKGGNIVESVVRMARWIGVSVIAEGVEKKEQADFLKSVGCTYIQGYLYSKPLPQEQYLAVLEQKGKPERMLNFESVPTYDSEAFWSPESMETIIFNSFVGGACIFEYHNNAIEIIRVNEKYTKILCGKEYMSTDAINLHWDHYLTPEGLRSTKKAMLKAIETKTEITDELEVTGIRKKGQTVYIHAMMRVIANAGDRYLFYCVMEDITKQREAEKKERLLGEQLKIILRDMNGGVHACTTDDKGKMKIIFANARFYEQRGYTKQEYTKEVKDLFDVVHPDEIGQIKAIRSITTVDTPPYRVIYRVIKRDGTIRWLRNKISFCKLEGYDQPVQISITDDITGEREAVAKVKNKDTFLQLILNNVGSGITATALNSSSVEYLFANEQYYLILGYTRQQYHEEIKDAYSLIHSEDRERVRKAANSIIECNVPMTIDYRIACRNGSYKYIRMVTVNTMLADEDAVVQLSVFSDITGEIQKKNTQKELLENLPCGAGVFEIKEGSLWTIYLNTKYWKQVGRTEGKNDFNAMMDSIQFEDRAYFAMALQKMIVTGHDLECEVHVLHGDGSYKPFLVRGNMVRRSNGTMFLYATYTTITESAISFRHMLPVALETMMASSTDLSFVKDRTLRYVCASHAFAQMAGYEDENEIIGKTDYDLFEKEMAEKFRTDDKKLLREKKALVNYVERLPMQDGMTRYSNTSKYILRDSSGNIIGIYGIGRDITEDKEAFSRLKTLTDTIPGGLATYEVTPNGARLLYITDGIYDFFGYDRETIFKWDPLSFILEEDRTKLQEKINDILYNGIPLNDTCRVMHKDGSIRWINLRGLETEREGQNVKVNTVMFDVTDQIIAREKIDVLELDNRKRYEHELQLRRGLVKDSLFYYQVNLTTGIVEEYVYTQKDHTKIKKGNKITDAVMKAIVDKIYPADQEKVKELIFIDKLKKAYCRGEKNISIVYRREVKKQIFVYLKMDAYILEKPDNGDLIAFLCCKNVDREWKNTLAIETILDEDMESIFHINVDTGIATIAHLLEKVNYNKVYNDFLFDLESKKCCSKFVVEEDKEGFLQFYNVASLVEMLQRDKIVTTTYRIKEKSIVSRKMAKAYYLNEIQDTIVLTRRDITKLDEEEQRQKKELQDAVENANKANKAKSDFLSNMSHDIRTPLNAVLTLSGKELLENADEKLLREYLYKINLSGEYLLGIINDVLDMSRIEQNRIVLNPTPYFLEDFEKTIRNVIDELSRKREVQFVLNTNHSGVPEMIVDHIRFNQIFINLLSNAVKFTPKGGKVEFIIEEIPTGQEPVMVKRFTVRDNGIGMSEEFIPHAFDSFSQEYRKGISDRNQGTGLGLSIVKELVEMMDGTISLESALNKGTTFTLEFPVNQMLTSEAKPVKENAEEQYDYNKLSGIRVLLAEDNDINAEIAAALFEKHGTIVERAENGNEACEMFETSKQGYYQLIFMDIRMPIMDGLEATKQIRNMKRKDAKSIPIIAMTADAFINDEDTAFQTGMNAYVAKPINSHKLYDISCCFLNK